MNTPVEPARGSGTPAVDYDPFAAPALARVVPSTEAQREIWLAAKQGDAASLAYNEAVALTLRGALRRDALLGALQDLVDRHDSLRATFGPDGETFCVAEALHLAVVRSDLSALDASARAAALDARRTAMVSTAFDLEHGPLWRAELLQLGDDEHVLLLCAHHLVCDGWSWWVIVRELGALYTQRAGATTATLASAPAFADYALALGEPAARGADAADEAWWVAQYAAPPGVLDLPGDRPHPTRRSFASAREDYLLPAALVGDLRHLAAHHGVSLFAALLGSFAGLLGRLAGSTEVVLGIPAAAQASAGMGDLVGHGVHLLPLRCGAGAALPFRQLLKQAGGTLLDALDHQRCTFGSLVRQLDLPRDNTRPALVSVMFNIDQALDQESAAFSGLELAFASVPRRFEQFELSVNAVQEAGALRLECQYATDLFDATTVRRWMRAFETLLRAGIEHSECALGVLPLLDAQAVRELQGWQPVPRAWGADAAAMHAAFERQAAQTPDRVALTVGVLGLTYRALDERANQLAHGLVARGVQPGDLVGVALERGADMLVAVLGVLKTGAGYVPLDPGFPTDRLSYMAGDARLALLLAQGSQLARFASVGCPVVALDALPADWARLPTTRPRVAIDPAAIAYVIYTSGSTGKPKGVAIPHRAAANFLASMAERPGLHAEDRVLAVTTLSFDIAVLELFGALGVGGEVVLATHDQAADGAALQTLLAQHRISVMQATPATWRMLLQTGWQGDGKLRALCGGEALAPELATALLARCGELWNLYGPTETTVWSTCAKIEPGAPINIGTPIANTTVWVLDERRERCPVGVPGELWIGGAGVALGYLHRDDLTAERFIADPFSAAPGARLYRTGDCGRWLPNGTLEHLGRADFQIKLRGFRIEPGEIESRLASCPGVREAVVIVREDRPGDQRLVAYVVADAPVDARAAREHLRGSLPDYMLPQHVVTLATMPLTPNGKLDRKRLPPPVGTMSAVAPTAPRDELERQVATAMADVLGCPAVGSDEDFFALGGHSLLAAQLAMRLDRALDVDLTLRDLFDAPTVARLADLIRAARARGTCAAAPIARRADRAHAPLSLMQQRVWYLEQLHPGSAAWHTPSAHRLCGLFDHAAFARALQTVVRRQAVLRTAIQLTDDGPTQCIHTELEVALPLEDLTALPGTGRDAYLQQRLAALIAEPFDLTVAPLFRVRLFKLGAEHHVFFFMAHHVIWDGWSFDLLYREMGALYAAYAAGQENPLPPLAIEYGDFALWQRAQMQGEELARQLAPWLERLRNPPAPLELPADHPRPARMSGAGATEWVRIPGDQLAAVHALATQQNTTPFVVLLAAFTVLLHRLSGQHEMIVGVPVRNRDEAELESVMGFFVNALPLRLAVADTASFADCVGSVRRAVLDGFSAPGVPFEELVRALHLPRDDSRPPLAQAMFSFQDVRGRVTQWGGLAHEHLPVFQRGSAEDIGLWFIEQDAGLLGGMSFNADLFDAATVARFRAQYETLLAGLVAHPLQPVGAGEPAPSPAVAVVTSTPVMLKGNDVSVDARQQQLAAIWRELIGAGDIRPEDNFFDLGGHSLLAVEMVTRVQRELGVTLKLIDVATGTLATLAAGMPEAGKQTTGGLGGRVRRWFGRR